MLNIKTITAAALIVLAPLPASAHGFGPPAIAGGIIGGILGGIAAATGGYPPPYYAPRSYDYAPAPAPIPPAPVAPTSDPDIAYVQHALNVLAGSNLVEDGVGGPATKAALLTYLGNQMKAAGQS